MAYVVVREQPDGSGNHYKYLYRSFRNEAGDVETEFLQYLGKADGPDDKKITKDEIDDEILEKYDVNENDIKEDDKVIKGYEDQKIEKHSTTEIGNIDIYVDEDMWYSERKKAKNVSNEWAEKATKGQLNNIERIEFYQASGQKREIGKERITAGADYNPGNNRMRIFNSKDMANETTKIMMTHEAAHNTFTRLKKEAKKQRDAYEWKKERGYLEDKTKKQEAPAAYLYDEYKNVIKEEGPITDYAQKYAKAYEQDKKTHKEKRTMNENLADIHKEVVAKGNKEEVKESHPESYKLYNWIMEYDDEGLANK